MVNLQIKMGQMKSSLKSWNKIVFGIIFEKLKQAEEDPQKV